MATKPESWAGVIRMALRIKSLLDNGIAVCPGSIIHEALTKAREEVQNVEAASNDGK